MAALAITRQDRTAADLRREASLMKDSDAARRMLAIALVLDDFSRKEAAELCGMDRQTLRDWVHRYNAEGLAGLSNSKPPGRKPCLNREELAKLVAVGRRRAGACAGWRCALAARRFTRPASG